VGRTLPSTDAAHLVERADHASHIAQSRPGSAALKGAGPMLPTDGRCARLSIGAAAAAKLCGYLSNQILVWASASDSEIGFSLKAF
jgi:hypothetical protein